MRNQSAAELIARLKRAYPAYEPSERDCAGSGRFSLPAQTQRPHGDGAHSDRERCFLPKSLRGYWLGGIERVFTATQ